MFGFMSSFSEFVGFVIASNVRVGMDFVYSESVGSLLQHLYHFRHDGFVWVVGM